VNGRFPRLYVAFMDKHPELLDKLDGVGVSFVMQDAFPCKK